MDSCKLALFTLFSTFYGGFALAPKGKSSLQMLEAIFFPAGRVKMIRLPCAGVARH